MLTSWKIDQQTDINLDGVETRVTMSFTSFDGTHIAYSLAPEAARLMAGELGDMAEAIEPAPVKRRFPWAGWFMGYCFAALIWGVAESDWLQAGLFGVALVLWYRKWRRP